MEIVIISGTPGTGKTTISTRISEIINVKVISLNELAIAEDLILDYDKKRETNIIDIGKVLVHVKELINSYKKHNNFDFIIIESHFSDIISNDLINYPIVLRCHPDELIKRLKERGYKKEKIIENVQSEILGNSVNYLLQKQLEIPLIEIDTTNLSIDLVVQIIIDIIQDNKNSKEYSKLKVDWLETLFQEDRLDDFFD